jgi:hypothetical protein
MTGTTLRLVSLVRQKRRNCDLNYMLRVKQRIGRAPRSPVRRAWEIGLRFAPRFYVAPEGASHKDRRCKQGRGDEFVYTRAQGGEAVERGDFLHQQEGAGRHACADA